MSRDYGARQSVGRKSKSSHQWLTIVCSFLFGYLTASFLSTDAIGHWMNTQVLAYHETKNKPKVAEAIPKKPHHKPKFEFYTLLANEKGTLHSAEPEVEVQSEKPQNAVAKASEMPPLTTKVTETTKTSPVSTTKNNPTQVLQAKNTVPSKQHGSYLIQVASFKARKDAEHMKALLTLKGYEVAVTPVNNPNGYWFRVLIGPYGNRALAQKAQVALSKSERINGMVRPVDG